MLTEISRKDRAVLARIKRDIMFKKIVSFIGLTLILTVLLFPVVNIVSIQMGYHKEQMMITGRLLKDPGNIHVSVLPGPDECFCTK